MKRKKPTYRVLQKYKTFYVQRKFLFFWLYVKQYRGPDCSGTPRKFYSLVDAQDYINRQFTKWTMDRYPVDEVYRTDGECQADKVTIERPVS